ncbi:MAG: hypothetical protein ACI4SG_02710 [Oligosphaeraceae bacterium]
MSRYGEYFTAPGHPYNCAQSVALGNGREELVEELSRCGGGRAPEGICGALHAALLLAPEEERPALQEAFRKEAGALTCREIKGGALTPCVQCVEIAAALLEKAQGRI